jgi:hypothetical protein
LIWPRAISANAIVRSCSSLCAAIQANSARGVGSAAPD